MKRFILSTLAVTVFFLGLGSLVERTGAKFKSDDKALALIAKARAALGGDAALANIQSLRIVGRTTKTFKVDGAERTHSGDTEIAMQFPDKLMRTVKVDGGTGDKVIVHDMKVAVGEPAGEFKIRMDVPPLAEGVHKKIVIKKDDGTEQTLTDADADKWIAEHPGVPGEKRIVIKKDDGTATELPGAPSDRMIIRHPEVADGNATFTSKDGKTFNVVVDHAAGAEGGMRQNEILRFALGREWMSSTRRAVTRTSTGRHATSL